jgi:hypothetical protein
VTRREHYEKAEKILADIDKLAEELDGMEAPPELAQAMANAVNISLLTANVHASLAGASAEAAGEQQGGYVRD